MCYAIPGKIISIKGETAVVDYDGIRKNANITLVNAKKGDYVLVHAGFAIQAVNKAKARDSLKLTRQALKWKGSSNK
ncbi:MAG: HypC/HybG/HupF family hydrogenase formation chaperone [Candidatus Woesearchaeota archaeon]